MQPAWEGFLADSWGGSWRWGLLNALKHQRRNQIHAHGRVEITSVASFKAFINLSTIPAMSAFKAVGETSALHKHEKPGVSSMQIALR